MQSILKVNITMFERANKPDSYRSVCLLDVLQSNKYKALAYTCSRITDKKQRQAFKLQNVPVITVSGLFEGSRKESKLIKHSGLICLDLDGVQDIDTLKSKVCKLPFVAYCGKSISGTGLFVIVPIPISTPEEHKQRYAALESYFIIHFGIIGTVDPQPKNVAACRYVSYDPQAYYNHAASVLDMLPKVVPAKPVPFQRKNKRSFSGSTDYEKVWEMADKIQDRHLDFCPDYADYLRVAFSLAAGLGESGRDVFHTICGYSTKYNYKEVDTKYSEALKHGSRTTLGTFFSMCKDFGLMPERQTIQIPVYVPKRKAVTAKPIWLTDAVKVTHQCKIGELSEDSYIDYLMNVCRANDLSLEEYVNTVNEYEF